MEIKNTFLIKINHLEAKKTILNNRNSTISQDLEKDDNG